MSEVATDEGTAPAATYGELTFTPTVPDGGMAHESVSFPSTDGSSTCVGDLWLPAGGSPRAIVEVCHGMVEHLGCYRALAEDLTRAGLAMVGADVIGHGRSCPDPEERGVYDPNTGKDTMVEDLDRIRHGVEGRLPGVPIILLGHSMGSFVVRCYAGRHGRGLAGLVVLGTAWQPGFALAAGTFLTDVISVFHGWGYRSKLVDGLGCGGYNKAFEGTGDRTGYEWLSRDPVRPRAYAADPDCGWTFSISGYHVLFALLREAQSRACAEGVPHDLPVLVLSGSDDPVGSRGDGPAQAFDQLKQAGVEDVTFDLFDGARHELLCETCRAEVLDEILAWVDALPAMRG